MPLASLPGVTLNYQIDGPESAPWLVLCNSLGTDLSMWSPQVAELSTRFRLLRYDRRGHGASSVPAGGYGMAVLGGDVVALMDHLGIARAHFCGLSIGGLTGQWLGLTAPQRVEKLVLCCTGAKIGSAESWSERSALVRDQGMAAVAAVTIGRWFTPEFVALAPEPVSAVRRVLESTAAQGYLGCIQALIEADFRAQLPSLRLPLMTLAGQADPVTPPSSLEAIAQAVPGARSVLVPGAHLCNIESPAAFNAALIGFLQEH